MGVAIWLGLLALGLTGCIEGHPAIRKANETAALAQLRKYSTAQSILSIEEGRYAHSLSELYDRHLDGVLDAGLREAWHSSPDPVPLSGYLFSDLEMDEHGGRLTDPLRCGLAAYPAEPGRTGDVVLLILVDDGAAPAPAGPVDHGNWRMFRASHEEVQGPVTRWPSEHDLRTRFQEIRRLTPEEGLATARGR